MNFCLIHIFFPKLKLFYNSICQRMLLDLLLLTFFLLIYNFFSQAEYLFYITRVYFNLIFLLRLFITYSLIPWMFFFGTISNIYLILRYFLLFFFFFFVRIWRRGRFNFAVLAFFCCCCCFAQFILSPAN